MKTTHNEFPDSQGQDTVHLDRNDFLCNKFGIESRERIGSSKGSSRLAAKRINFCQSRDSTFSNRRLTSSMKPEMYSFISRIPS